MKTIVVFWILFSLGYTSYAQSDALPETEKGQEREGLSGSGFDKGDKENIQKQPLTNKVSFGLAKDKKSKDQTRPSNTARPDRRETLASHVLYFNDFLSDRPGAMPEGWFSNDSCQLVELKPWPGRWLSLAKKGRYAPADSFILPETYTLEFDVLMLSPPEEGLGTLSISLAAIEEENPTQAWKYLYTRTDLYVGFDYSTFTVEQAGRPEKVYVENNVLRQALGQPVHIVLEVKEGHYTLFANDQKVVDIPDLMKAGHRYNRLLVNSQLSKTGDRHQMLVSNFKLSAAPLNSLQSRSKPRNNRQ